jgi:SAM-dependent methyltransferase
VSRAAATLRLAVTAKRQRDDIEGLDAELQARGKDSRWERYRLPVELEGKSFLDVGCWEGVHCAEAVRRGASDVVGVDLCTDPDLSFNVERYGFEFLQMDVFSEKWLELGSFDVVLCSGLLFHTESPFSLILRLRRAARELLVIETGVTTVGGDQPIMVFHGGGEGTPNPSNWWWPNRACLEQMLLTAGFEGVTAVWEAERQEGFGRLCLQAVPSAEIDRGRILPRKRSSMSVFGGTRRGGDGGDGGAGA